MKTNHVLALAVVISSVIPTQRTAAQQAGRDAGAHHEQARTNRDALIIGDFKNRIDDYGKVHDTAVKAAPPLKPTHDPAKIKNAQDALAARISEMRAGANQGDIFTPAIAAHCSRVSCSASAF